MKCTKETLYQYKYEIVMTHDDKKKLHEQEAKYHVCYGSTAVWYVDMLRHKWNEVSLLVLDDYTLGLVKDMLNKASLNHLPVRKFYPGERYKDESYAN